MLRGFVRLSLLLTLAGPTLAHAFVEPVAAVKKAESPWTPVQSDLPPDPLLRDGTLPNGVRYLILPNAEPKGHVSMRLVVGVGSLQEHDDERGLAHFVEHMAFRGTKEFPNGKLAERLQREGIAFGPDSTAFTAYDHTIYHLELPNAAEPTVRLALHAFREYATNVTFDPALIERERGVVLSEMATRDTPDARAGDFNLRMMWPKSREVRRKVIGETLGLRTFSRTQFIDFYDAWYRPERVALIIVGSIEAANVEALVREEFGGIGARAPARPDPNLEDAHEIGPPDVGVFHDPGMVGLWIGLEHASRDRSQPDTHATRVKELHAGLAFAMFQMRLRKIANEPGSPLVAPTASLSAGIHGWQMATVGANGRMTDWQSVATELEQQHRKALQFGFTAAELVEARTMFTTQYEESIRSASTRPSSWLAQQLVQTLLYGTSFTTPAARQRDLAPDLAAARLSDCLVEFRAAWIPGAATVFAVANTSFGITRQQLVAVLNGSRETPVTPPENVALAEFGYADFGKPGTLVRNEHLPDLDVRLTEFANHVKFNFKTTPFEADTVEVRVRVGDGKISQPKSYPGLDLLANSAFAAGGLGKHRYQEIGDILAGHALQVSFQVGTDACNFYARCARREVPLAVRVIAAYITDPGYRAESMRDAQAQFGSITSALLGSPGGPITALSLRELYNGDGRFGLPSYDEFSGLNLGEMRGWLGPQLDRGPIELSVVGDISWEEAQAAVATTFGALGERGPVTDRVAPVPVTLEERPAGVKLYSIPSNMKQAAVAWYWPVDAVSDIQMERRCYLLAAILQERVRIKLREELGATYAPMVGFSHLDGFPNANYFAFYAEVEPAKVLAVLTVLEREATALSKKGPTADEFERGKQPYLRSMTDDVRTNAYWGGTVLSDAQQRPTRIAAARNRAASIVAITRNDVAVLAKRFLAPARAYKFATLPARPAP